MQSPRKTALDILLRVDTDGSYSNLALDAALEKARLSGRDASFVTALVYGVTERRLTLDYWITAFARRPVSKIQPVLRNILRLGICQLIFLDKVPGPAAVNESVELAKAAGMRYAAGFVNGVLRAVDRGRGDLPYPDRLKDEDAYLAVRYSCPKWLIGKWAGEYGREELPGLLESLHTRRPLAGCVNSLKTTPEELLETLAAQGVEARLEPLLGGAGRDAGECLVFDRLPDLRGLPAFKDGLFLIQGRASQLCCRAVGPRPGETVLDLCAAPGGKSFHMAFLMGGRGVVRSCEVYESRLQLIEQGARRLGITIVEPCRNDASVHNPALGEADRVLCDVPCSGLGVVSRKPEIRYRDPASLEAFPPLQYAILCEGAAHVREGGLLAYSTCTLSRAENDEVALRFLGEHPDFCPAPLPACMNEGQPVNAHTVTLLPHRYGTDGFFIALFERRARAADVRRTT